MPRQAKTTERGLPERTLVVDNGAYSIKAGFATPESAVDECQIVPNCIAKDRGKHVWVGPELDKCRDFGELAFRRPVEKGFLVNWEAEKAIWDETFINDKAPLKCDPHETNLILGEAPNAPAALQTNCDQVVFEEYEFATYSRHIGPSLNSCLDIAQVFGDNSPNTSSTVPAECLLVVDAGYSHSTVTPLFRGRAIQQAIRRLDIGGKLLTNYLKELVSIRHYNMLDETHLINEVKEATCFVSDDFKRDLDLTYKGTSQARKRALGDDKELKIDYILPDYNAHKSGYVRPHDPSASAKLRKLGSLTGSADVVEDYMTLGNERFAVPELLFHPSDVGMQQLGIPELVMSSLSGVPTGIWPAMLANVLVVGGTSKMTGFMERLELELRQLAPAECKTRVIRAPDPIRSTWMGGCGLAENRSSFRKVQVTRQDYQEFGSGWLAKTFAGGFAR